MADDRYSDIDDEVRMTPKPVQVAADDQAAQRYGNDDLLSRVHEERNGVSGAEYREETAADFAAPRQLTDRARRKHNEQYAFAGEESGGRGIGITALIVSILSLFILPIVMGIFGIILGFIARSKGASSLGTWAVMLGALSIIVGIFILPFF